MEKNRTSGNVFYVIGYIIIFIRGLDYISSNHDGNNMMIMLCAGIIGAVATLTRILISKFAAGTLTQVLKSCILKFGWGISLFLFLHVSQNDKASMASIGVLILSFAVCGFEIEGLISNSVVAAALLRAFSYILTGIGMKILFIGLWDGIWKIGIDISAGDMALWGYIVLSVCSLLSLLCLSEDNYLSRIGKWFGKGHNYKFMGVCLAIFILKDLQFKLIESMPGQVVIAEWAIAFLVLLVVLFIIMSKANIFFPTSANPNLNKHMLEVKFAKEKDLQYVSRYISDFVEKGEKGRLVSYVACLANELGMSNDQISKTIYPILEYRDIVMPHIYFKREIMIINERNMENRRVVVNKIIDYIGVYHS